MKPLALMLLIYAVLALSLYLVDSSYLHPSAWAIALYFAVLLVLFQVLGQKAARDPELGQTLLLGLRVGHMLFSLIFAGLFIFLDREHAVVFTVNFFLAYLVAAAFEIRGLVANLRPNSEREEHQQHHAADTSE